MGSESYWLDTAPAFTGAQLGALPGQVDVAIVGGGFTGLAAARALALKGASVVVLEADSLMFECKAGPYRPVGEGELADWAPREGQDTEKDGQHAGTRCLSSGG